jgi:hypothetical protein
MFARPSTSGLFVILALFHFCVVNVSAREDLECAINVVEKKASEKLVDEKPKKS